MVEQRKRELVIQLAKARGEIDQGREDMRHGLSIPMQFRRLIMRPEVKWIAGSLGTVILLGLFKRKQPKVQNTESRVGFFRWFLRLAIALAKPSLTKFAVDRVRSEFENRLMAVPRNRGLAHPFKSDLS